MTTVASNLTAGFQNASSPGAATAGASTSTNASGTTSSIAQNFDQFLSLLTTQLKNQNPLDPLDTNQFTAQLVQFAGVEQQLKTNETLASLLTLNKTGTTTNAVSFIGATVTADGASAPLRNGAAEWKVNLPRAGVATVTIKNASGSVVKTETVSLQAGDQPYRWDGKTSTGTNAPDGEYAIAIDAKDVSGQALTVKTEIKGVVDGVDLSETTPFLTIGGVRIAIDKVKTVVRPQAEP